MRERKRVPLGMARIRWRGCTLRLDTEGRERENVVHGRGLWFRLVLWEQVDYPAALGVVLTFHIIPLVYLQDCHYIFPAGLLG